VQACVLTSNYGEAGALSQLAAPGSLPPIISGHNNYYLWGPGTCTGQALIAVGYSPSDFQQSPAHYAAAQQPPEASSTTKRCLVRDVLRRPYRDDPEATVARLASVQMDGLPDDLAPRVFGLWSNACAQLIQQRGWHQPYRYAPATSRSVVFARSAPEGPYEVVSALGSPDWQPGQLVVGSLPRGVRELATR